MSTMGNQCAIIFIGVIAAVDVVVVAAKRHATDYTAATTLP
jgi:hypothetical protein